jgi:hypothetical protein
MSSLYRSILNAQGSSFASTNSFEFDGSTDYVQTPTITFASDFSVSVWFKKTSAGTYRQLIGGSNFFLFSMVSFDSGVFNGEICYWNGGVYVRLTDDTAADGNWHNLILTYKQSTQSLKSYFDGSIYYNATFNVGSSPSISIIGKNTTYGRQWGGNIDEVAVWNTELSSTDANTIYNGGVPNDLTSLSPISWWRMGEAANYSGGQWTLTDQGSGVNDGTSTTLPAPPAQPSTDVPT